MVSGPEQTLARAVEGLVGFVESKQELLRTFEGGRKLECAQHLSPRALDVARRVQRQRELVQGVGAIRWAQGHDGPPFTNGARVVAKR